MLKVTKRRIFIKRRCSARKSFIRNKNLFLFFGFACDAETSDVEKTKFSVIFIGLSKSLLRVDTGRLRINSIPLFSAMLFNLVVACDQTDGDTLTAGYTANFSLNNYIFIMFISEKDNIFMLLDRDNLLNNKKICKY